MKEREQKDHFEGSQTQLSSIFLLYYQVFKLKFKHSSTPHWRAFGDYFIINPYLLNFDNKTGPLYVAASFIWRKAKVYWLLNE